MKGKPTSFRDLNQIDMHKVIQSSSETNLNKVLEEKSPKGEKETDRGSTKNIHGIFSSSKLKKRDSFPPYEEMGSEKGSEQQS